MRASPKASTVVTVKYYASEPLSVGDTPLRTQTISGPLLASTVTNDCRANAAQFVLTNNTASIDRAGQIALSYVYDDAVSFTSPDGVVQSYHYTVFRPNDTPSLNFYPTSDGAIDIPAVRNDYGVGIISGVLAAKTIFRLRIIWLIEYIPTTTF